MKVLLSWMQQFAPIEGDPAELAETLTDLGLVVEEVSTVGADLDGIIVAKVLELAPHPEADRIQVVQVDTGDGTPLQICCGAFNMAVGDLVPLATIGTTMPGGMEIAQRKLRGQMSNGMLCSPAELELAADADGIMVLDPSLTLGQPITEALALESDVLFDIDVEGNRPDALSVIGVARDLAAKLGVPFTEPSPVVAESSANTADLASVEILDGELCPRFGIRVLENVTMGSSPEWMAARLTAAGMRPINSIVDISNYVMLELGQPNHTYDLDTVPDGALRVRRASEGETLVTLDGKLRSLTPADGVIANAADEPIGLAGVMGGEATEIGPSTSRVLLEAAIWDRMMIAKTSRRLNLRSEASTRYERGVDHAAVERALDRFCELAIELCGATVASGAIIADGRELPAPVVTLRTARVNQLLGSSLTTDEIANFLTPIGFANTADGPDALTVTIPSWRPDSTMETDIVEEVGRHYGYDKVGTLVPRPAQSGGLTHRQTARRRVRHAVAGIGFDEAMPMPFLSPADQAAAGISDEAIGLTNPLVHEESILRTSLLPGLVKAVASNQARSNDGVRLFELGRVYLRNPKTLDDPVAAPLPIEPERLGLVWAEPTLAARSGCSSRSPVYSAWRTFASTTPTARRRSQPSRSSLVCTRTEPPRSSCEVARSAPSARSIRACSRHSTSRAAWPGSVSTSTRCSPPWRPCRRRRRCRSIRPASSTSPLSSPTTSQRRRWPARSTRPAARCCDRSRCSTCSAASRSVPTAARSPIDSGSRPTIAR
ncbi:MAG: phenylalanine--tRNA ligase subunit beta [Acidimicrobiales bacterium]